MFFLILVGGTYEDEVSKKNLVKFSAHRSPHSFTQDLGERERALFE